MPHIEDWFWDITCDRWFPFHHHPHRKARPIAPVLFGLTIKERRMAIAGVTVPTVDITLTLPTQRKDGTDLNLNEIQSATIIRDSGSGPNTLTTLNGPFNGSTATFSDVSPVSGSDLYSFYVTDTAGTQGDTSPTVSVTIEGQVNLAPPAAGTLTAVARAPDTGGSNPTPNVSQSSTDVNTGIPLTRAFTSPSASLDASGKRPDGAATTGPADGAPTSSTQVPTAEGGNTTVLPKN